MIEFDISAYEKELLKRLEGLGKQEKLISNDIGSFMVADADKNFSKESTPDKEEWHEWSPKTHKSYEKLSKKKGKDYTKNKKLQCSGALRQSLSTFKSNGKETSLGSNLKYARIHQKGGMAGRNKKVHIPARPYIGFGSRLRNKIKRYLIEKAREINE